MSKERYQWYMGTSEIIDNKTKKFITQDCPELLNKQSKQIADLETKLADLQEEQTKEMQEHQEAMLVGDNTIKMLEKALEMACETIKSMCPRPLWIGGTIPAPEIKDAEYFKEIAKDMMKNE